MSEEEPIAEGETTAVVHTDTPVDAMITNVFDSIRIFDSQEIPQRVQAILGMRAMGWRNKEIAELLGYKDASGVAHVLGRYDPTKEIDKADAMRRMVLVSITEQIIFKGLLAIANSEEKLDAKDWAKIVSSLGKFTKDIQAPARIKASANETDILKKLLSRDEKVITEDK